MIAEKVIPAVINYERQRAEVRRLEGVRKSLIDRCDNIDDGLCLVAAHSELLAINEHASWDERYSYHEVLSNGEEGEYCEHCQKSYEIKLGPLAEARAKFGEAKRALSRIGKKLISA